MRGAILLAIASLACARAAYADSATGLGRGGIGADTGAAVYQHVCQGCHMPGGRGAVGAGRIPALANDPRLAEVGYPEMMVLNGHGGMPWFNGFLTDAQIAAVIDYVRSNFGNHYTDTITAADVAAVAGPPPHPEK